MTQWPMWLRKGGVKVPWGQNHSRRFVKPLFHLQVLGLRKSKSKELSGASFPMEAVHAQVQCE